MSKRDLIVFGEDWGGLPSSTQHLMKHIALERKILWVNSIGLRSPKLSRHDIHRALRKALRFFKTNKNTQSQTGPNIKNLTVINPMTLPAPRKLWQRRLAAWLLRRQLLPLISQLKLNAPILWSSLPTAADLAGALQESAVVYYCGDDFSSLAGVDHDVITRHETRLVEKSDLIITASKSLCEKFPHAKTRELSHGVDLSLFTKPAPRAKDLPENDRPTAGFYGSLSSWLDIALLKYVVKVMPDWNFVFIGHESVDVSVLKAFDNTYFLGPRNHEALPGYSQHWQASLLPFRDTPQIRQCNPLKLKEYLAVKKPIVATPFPALSPYVDLIHCADTPEAFSQALAASLKTREDNSRAQSMVDAVSQMSWNNRAHTVSTWLEAL